MSEPSAFRPVNNEITRRRRILVVEDEYTLASFLCDELVLFGYEPVGPVATQQDAVRLAVEAKPDLVLMDIRLAQGNGIAAAIEIRERTGIRCVFATAQTDKPTRARVKAAHPAGWVRKPYTGQDVAEALAAALP
jgi:CheY-like chemotaxis protein